MSNPQWPRQGGNQNPWAQDDPNWAPQTYQEHAGRDPRRPFGEQPEAPEMGELEPPRKPVWPWIVGVVAVVVAVLLFLNFLPEEAPPTASEQPVASEFPSPTTTGNALPFDTYGTGTFEITDYEWTDNSLIVDYRITIDDETRSFAFFTFVNETRESFTPIDDYLIEVTPDRPVEGTTVFEMPRGDITLVLTTGTGQAVQALPIEG